MKPHFSAVLLLGALFATPAFAADKAVSNAQTVTTPEEAYGNISVNGGSASLTVSAGGSLTATGTTELKSGGSIVIDGGSLTTQKLQLHNASSNASESFTLKSGTVTVTGTNKTLPGNGGGGDNTIVIGHWDRGGGAIKLSIEGGTFDAREGLVVVSWTSPGQLDISGGIANLYGVSIAGQPTMNHNAALNLSGAGVLNLGAGGLQSKASTGSKVVNLQGGTLGVLDSDWNADANVKMNLGGNVTVNTARTVAGAGEGQVVGSGATVNFKGTISGAGTMEKIGAGTLNISGTVSSSGVVFKATEGTIDFAGSSLASGTIAELNGGRMDNLTLQAGITLSQTANGGTLGDLTLAGGTVSFEGLDNAGYALSGTLEFGTGMTNLDFTGSQNYQAGSILFSHVMLGEEFNWNDDEWANYFIFSGTDQNWKVVFDSSTNSLLLAENDSALLTWNNDGNSGLWNTTDANWGDASTAFNAGDSVIFSATTGTVTVDPAGVTASRINIRDGAILTLAGGPVTGDVVIGEASHLTLGGSSIDGALAFVDTASKLTLTSTDSLSSTSTIKGAGTVEINWTAAGANGNINDSLAAFTGTLQISGGRYNAGASPLNATAISVANGGQFSMTGGAWSQAFTIEGAGWANSGDTTKNGALHIENTTINGTVSLAGDAGIQVTGAEQSKINGLITGNGYTLTKWGTGKLQIGNVGNGLNLTVEEGVLTLTGSHTYHFDTVTVKDGASFQDQWNSTVNIKTLNMNDGSTLDLFDGGSSSTPTLTFTTMNVTGKVDVLTQTNGALHIAGAVVGQADASRGGGATLHFTKGEGTSNIYLDSAMSGKLNITKDTGGELIITNANNTYEGDTSVTAGRINITGKIGGESNTYSAAANGSLVLSSATAQIRNAAVSVSRNGTQNATITHATVGTTSVSRESGASAGTISHAALNVTASAYAIEGIRLDNSLVTLKEAGTVTLSDVTLTGATQLAGDSAATGTKVFDFSGTGNRLTLSASAVGTAFENFDTGSGTLTSVYVYDVSSYFANATLTGHLDLDLSAFIDALPGGSKYIAFDFGDGNNVTLGDDFTAGITPNAFNDGSLAGTVSGHVVYWETKYVPEPSAAALGLLGLGTLLLRRQRKSQRA